MHLEPFDELSHSLIEEINTYGEHVTFDKGVTCMQGDDLLENFYIILNGRMKVFDINFDTNREQTIFMLTRGDVFDVVTLLDGQAHDVMTEAIDELSVIRLPMQKARHWLKSNPAFNQLLLPYIARQMRSLESLSVSLSLYDTSERLMRLIIDNLDPKTDKPDLLNNLSHNEIAKMIGSVRQVIERNLKKLQREGLLDVGRKTLLVKNLNQLKEKINHF